LALRGLSTNNSYWQAKQSILHTTAMVYGNCVKTYEDFVLNRPALWQSTIHTSFFYQTQHHCRPQSTLLFCFPDWRWPRQNRKRCRTPSQTRLPGYI
jgi:hypothetical protein